MNRMNLAARLASALALVAIAAPAASASFYATCTLDVQIQQVLSHLPPAPKPILGVSARFKVLKVLDGQGHTKTYCNTYPSKPFFEALLQTSDRTAAATVVPGARLLVAFRHVSGRTSNGVMKRDTWRLAKPATPVPPPSKNPLALAASCAKDPSGKHCSMTEGPLVPGVSADGKRLLYWDVKATGGCGDETPEVTAGGLVEAKVTKTGVKRIKKHTVAIPDPMEAPEDGSTDPEWSAKEAKAWTGLGKLSGFKPLDDLVKEHEDKPAGIQSHSPAAKLGGALAGWKVALTVKGKSYVVTLTDAKGKSHNIGRIKAPMVRDIDEETGKWKKAKPAPFPSIEQVSVFTSGGKQRIMVLTSAHNGAHCAMGTMAKHLVADLPSP